MDESSALYENMMSNLKLEDMSKEFLMKLIMFYAECFQKIDGFWYLSVMNELSEEKAKTCDLWVWKKFAKYEMDKITKLLDIRGKDVKSFFKAYQFSPWSLIAQYDMQIKDKNYGIITINHCPTLLALEKEGKKREGKFCSSMGLMMWKHYTDYFDPGIKITPLKLPPRESQGEICCQWEFEKK